MNATESKTTAMTKCPVFGTYCWKAGSGQPSCIRECPLSKPEVKR